MLDQREVAGNLQRVQFFKDISVILWEDRCWDVAVDRERLPAIAYLSSPCRILLQKKRKKKK